MPTSPRYDEIVGTLKKIVADVLKVPTHRIAMDSSLSDLAHVESIKLLRIAGKIERVFDIELDDEALFRKGTLDDLANEVILRTGAT